MKYQIVKDAQGKIVAAGPNDGMYDPTLKAGEVLSVQATFPASHIEDLANTKSDHLANVNAARTHALSLGFTEAMLAVMYPQLEEPPSE